MTSRGILGIWVLATMLVLAAGAVIAEEKGGHGGGHGGHDWGYEGALGPDHWGDLKPEFALCETGTAQSPIDVPSAGATAADAPKLEFHYQPIALRVVNNGHTIQVNTGGGYLSVNGERYDLAQFHFHTPSENKIDGKSFDGEMHLVHKNAAGKLAVVGVMLASGGENSALERMWKVAPAEEGPERSVNNVYVDPTAILPSTRSYFHWKGSLTTPPCTEGVEWFLMDKPLEISAATLGVMEKTMHGNARPPQPLGSRTVLHVGAKN